MMNLPVNYLMGRGVFQSTLVIPAKAGIQNLFVALTGGLWMPAYAGMTGKTSQLLNYL
jgi:hypothetical protein